MDLNYFQGELTLDMLCRHRHSKLRPSIDAFVIKQSSSNQELAELKTNKQTMAKSSIDGLNLLPETDYSSSKEFVIFRLDLITGYNMKNSRFFLFSMTL